MNSTTPPSAGALRAAKKIYPKGSPGLIEDVAALIDAESGLPTIATPIMFSPSLNQCRGSLRRNRRALLRGPRRSLQGPNAMKTHCKIPLPLERGTTSIDRIMSEQARAAFWNGVFVGSGVGVFLASLFWCWLTW